MDIQQLKAYLPIKGIQSLTPVSGGDVNLAYRVETTGENYFLLVQPNHPVDFYKAEIKGLKLFEEHGITAPQVIDAGEIGQDAYLLLSYLEEGPAGSQKDLGALVAKLHQVLRPQSDFGFDCPYQGAAIRFSNHWKTSWSALFLDERMDSLYKALVDQGLWQEEEEQLYQQARLKMEEALSQHDSQAVLLHGDLWAGNYMFLADGRPALFDPNPLYGDREFDLGISTVFGGFSIDFYQSYEEVLPLEKGAAYRLHFYRLYLYMVHLLKFGSSYASAVKRELISIIEG